MTLDIPPVPPEAVAAMRDRGGYWAAYQNSDLSSPDYQILKFLKVGGGCAFGDNDRDPPLSFPYPYNVEGRHYPYVGMVDLKTGTVRTDEQIMSRLRSRRKETPSMDPNACLDEIRDLVRDLSDQLDDDDQVTNMNALSQLLALIGALDEWISGGGKISPIRKKTKF